MKNIRTILLLSATCLTIMGAETSFASLNGASLLDYTGASATSTSICNNIIPSPKGNVKSHTHLVAASPSPHLSSSNWPQTQSEHRASFAPTSLALTDGVKLPQLEQRNLFAPIHQAQTDIAKLPQLASVCFITDAGNCAGLVNDEGWNLDNEDRCKEEGYDCTPCPGGSEAVDICPYSGNCHKSCKNTCDSAYNKSCNGADETGKGDSCNGLYKECCNLCSDYPYTDGNLPTGYVKSDSCNSCTGTKYKASCDTAYQYRCVDDGYDGNANKNGGSGASCDGKYKACNCKSGYNWNATTGTCDISCDPAYKFDCIKSSSTHISGGDGSACNGQYQRCTCTSPYTWSTTNNACTCPTTYKYACTGTGYSGGSGTACDGKYKKCTCKSGYEWKNGTCTKTCDSSYLYTCTDLNETGGSGDSCNNKYKSCTCKSGYIWNKGVCIKDCTGCNIGCIYFSDKSCSSIKESGKTPLGVVAYKNGSNMQIIALKNAADETTAFWTTNNTKAYSVNLPDYSTETAAAKDIDSCGNTAAIIATGNSSIFPGVYAAYNYRPTGTPSGQNWCLPAAGVLASIRDNILIINDSIKTAGGTKLNNVSLTWYWSSTFQTRRGTSLTYVWVYKTNGSTGEYNSLDKSIADHSSGWESLRTSFIFRSVLDVSSCSSSYKYTCSGTGYSGGYGTACGGKYTKCTCQSGYTWNAASGTCTANSSGPCDGKSNGANGNYYCCNNDVVGVKTSSMNFYVAMKDIGQMAWFSANSSCQSYLFCGNVKGTLPTKDQMLSIYHNKSQVNLLLSTNGGTKITEDIYWSSTNGDEYLYYYAVNMSHGGNDWNSPNTNSYYVRPILSTSSSGGGSTCDSSYKYTCTYSSSTHISGGSGTPCNGKYKKCNCMVGYNWNDLYGACQQECSADQIYTCPTYNGIITGGVGTPCNNKYSACTCKSGYTWSSSIGDCVRSACDSSYKYTCTYDYYSKISGGNGGSCDGKYKACQCMSGYTWNAASGTCTSSSSSSSSSSGGSSLNGAQGNLYYCNGRVVGVKASGMSFYVAMRDLGNMKWSDANSQCSSYAFCGSIKGLFPSKNQLATIYNNKSQVNSLLSINGGTEMTEGWYWSSTYEGTYGKGDKHYAVYMVTGGNYPWYDIGYSYSVRPILTSW